MGDLIRIVEFVREEPAIWVAFVFTLLVLVAILGEKLYTAGRYSDLHKAYEQALADRDYFRDRVEKLEQQLQADDEWRRRVLGALQQLTDVMQMQLPPEQNRWFSRWRP